MDDDELGQLRQEQNETLSDLAHAYPAITELIEASLAVEPFHDPDGEHELACRLIADEVFERHRDHLDALGSLHVLDLVTAVAGRLTGTPLAAEVTTSLVETTLASLRDELDHPDADDVGEVDDPERERELRNAAALVLAANSLQSSALDW